MVSFNQARFSAYTPVRQQPAVVAQRFGTKTPPFIETMTAIRQLGGVPLTKTERTPLQEASENLATAFEAYRSKLRHSQQVTLDTAAYEALEQAKHYKKQVEEATAPYTGDGTALQMKRRLEADKIESAGYFAQATALFDGLPNHSEGTIPLKQDIFEKYSIFLFSIKEDIAPSVKPSF